MLETKITYNNKIKLPGVDPLCADGMIHIRLRDYLEGETLVGFEQKLTYLIVKMFASLPIDVNDIHSDDFDKVWDKYYGMLLNNELFNRLLTGCQAFIPDFKGFKISKKYKRAGLKKPFDQFGIIDEMSCDTAFDIINSLAIDQLFSFVFSDNVTFQITKSEDRDYSKVYGKFVIKMNRAKKSDENVQAEQQYPEGYEPVDLWDND